VSLSDSIFDKLPKAWYAYCSFPAIFGAYHWIMCFVDYLCDSSKVLFFVIFCCISLLCVTSWTIFFSSMGMGLYKIKSIVIMLRTILTNFRKMMAKI
jgi:hypothetical protein